MAADGQFVSTTCDSLLRFDLFELDTSSSQFWRSGVPVDLPPQALRILILLAGSPNILVTREEIKRVLWPNESYGDFDSRLNFAIRKLREALSDSAERPRYIRTVRKAGYMFIAPVRPSSLAETSVSTPTAMPDLMSASSPYGGSGSVVPSSPKNRWVSRSFLIGFAWGFVLGVAAALALIQVLANLHPKPVIERISAVEAEQTQEIRITGRGLGHHVPFTGVGLDTPDLMIGDDTVHWMAGLMDADRVSDVTVRVQDWSDTLITIKGFSGMYGQGDPRQGEWKLHPGDRLRIRVWNPQHENAGFGECAVTVGSGDTVCSK
jgi:DNA-binding winged helix-turn-helix (wHTH) protein